MSLRRVRTVQWVLVAILAAIPALTYALGLGKLVVRSGLDEPLNGEVELLSATSQELKTLKTALASRADFDSAGIERPFFLTGIKYDVAQHKDGRAFLRLTTDEPVREPFLHLLLQVEWTGGKLIREYTALLDPPQWVLAKPTDIQTPEIPAPEATAVLPEAPVDSTAQSTPPPSEPAPTAVAAEVAPTTEPKAGDSVPPAGPVTETASAEIPPAETAAAATAPTELAPAESVAEAAASTPAAVESREPRKVDEGGARAWASAWDYGPVKKGETLSQITGKLRVDKTLTSQQVMLALLRANPSAFYGKNVNNLKSGMILKVPEREEVEAVSKGMASKEFQAQYEVWQKYKLKVADASSAVTVPTEKQGQPAPEVAPIPKAATSTAPVKAAPVKPAARAKKEAVTATKPAKGGDDDLLKIVRSNLDNATTPEAAKAPGVETLKDAAKEQRALTEKVATLEEAIESKELQNKEMRNRVGKMQEQVKNTSRLIDLENKDLAQAQKQATGSAKTKPAPVTPPVVAAPPAAAPPVAAATPPPVTAAQADAQAKAAPAKKPVLKAVSPPAPVEEPGFLQSLTDNIADNPLLLTVLAGVGVLGGGILAIYYVRRRRASAEFEESILSGGSVGPESSSMSESASQPGASDTSFLSDFSQGGMGNIHTDEVDPIAEAEVYLAYGRDEQAEEILKEAVVKDPARHELKQKLLEIYHQRNDVAGFETLAEELYAALEGKGGKVWDKVEEMGRKISPNNPMFRGGAPAGGSRAASVSVPGNKDISLDRDTSEHAPAAKSEPLAFEMDDMLRASPAAAASSAPSLDAGLDFDLGGAVSASQAGMDMELDTSATELPAAGGTLSGLDMDFNIQDEAVTSGHGTNSIDFAGSSAPLASNEISLDFDAHVEHEPAGDQGLSFSMDTNAADSPTLEFEAASESVDADVAVEEPQWDETATKLDLAKAYIDMGDAEGARSILDEVLAEGNESQKEQARDLAAQIT